MKINPTKVLVQDIIETESTTRSGIILANAVIKKDAMRGTVIAVGEGTPDIKIPYLVGETVLYPPKAGRTFHPIQGEEKEYRLVDVQEIFMGGE